MPLLEGPRIDATLFRQALGRYATGITLITGAQKDGELRYGMVANSFTSVSLDPPLVSFCAGKGSTTWPLIKATDAFAVNVLGAHHLELCRAFVGKAADSASLLSDAPRGLTGSPLLPDALASIDCRIRAIYDAGDHEVVIGEVLGIGRSDEGDSLLFYGGRYAHGVTEL
jgi:3-hydroxy-9,10-secoandrosta-1,3,5(10)-triene-9,17-dione monooxygenase reductase component